MAQKPNQFDLVVPQQSPEDPEGISFNKPKYRVKQIT